MDKRRQELEELQDDIHLALLMDEYAKSMGAEIRAEAEKAFESGEMSIPKDVDDACASILAQTTKHEHSKKSTKTVIRHLLVAAATVIALLGTLVAVQAAGIDVFGRLASWTDSVFHFNSETDVSLPEGEKENPEIETALSELGLPAVLAPMQLPEGYEVIDIKQVTTNQTKLVGIAAEKDGGTIQIFIEEYIDLGIFDKSQWEKDEQSAQIYTSNGRTFYLFENESGWTGVWSDGRYAISLQGFESLKELQTTIASIGVN